MDLKFWIIDTCSKFCASIVKSLNIAKQIRKKQILISLLHKTAYNLLLLNL